MQTPQSEILPYQISFPGLPLAVYRELAAHLRQVEGVEPYLIPQQSREFDYNQSQIEGLWIQFGENADATCRQRVDQILAYYKNRYCSR